jgi:hypothetical protein
MFSNLPTRLQDQDFHARHRDMLAAAQCEPLTKEQIEHQRLLAEISDKFYASCENNLKALKERLADAVFCQGEQWGGLLSLLEPVKELSSGVAIKQRYLAAQKPLVTMRDIIKRAFVDRERAVSEQIEAWKIYNDRAENFQKADAKIGAVLRVRLPSDDLVSDGPALKPPEVVEEQTDVSLRTITEYVPERPTPEDVVSGPQFVGVDTAKPDSDRTYVWARSQWFPLE